MEILNSLIIILAVGFGFYLGRFQEINKKVGEVIQKIKPKPKNYGEPFVVATDEAELERKQKEAEEKKERIELKEILEEKK